MKDDQEHIDKLFESLNDRQFDIPEAFLEDLNKRLDNEPKKKRKYGFLWFLVPLVLIGGIGIFCFLNVYKQEANPATDNADKLIAKNKSKEDSHTLNQTNYHFNEQTSHQTKSVDSANASKHVIKTQVNTPKNKNQELKSPHSILWNPKNFKGKKAPGHPHSQTPQTAIQKMHTEFHSENQINETKLFKKNGAGKKKLKLKTKKNKVFDTEKEATLSSLSDDKTLQASGSDPADKIAANTKTDKEESIKQAVPEKETDSTLAQTTSDSTQQVNTIQSEDDNSHTKLPKNNWKKEIQLFAGLGGNSMHDSPKTSDYLSKMNQNQQSILAPSFGVNANLSCQKFTFGLGLNYGQTGEKFKVEIKNTELKDSTYSEIIQDTVWVQDSLGNWFPTIQDTTIYHTVQYMDSTWESRSFQNRYSWISIPIRFGYRFELGNYELIPRLGAVFNFGIAQGMGNYPNASFTNTTRYKPVTFNVSYLIELEVRRNFKKWFVSINPYFRSMISPAISGDVIRRRYTSWGVQFGVGFNL